jgi:surface-anchored protein
VVVSPSHAFRFFAQENFMMIHKMRFRSFAGSLALGAMTLFGVASAQVIYTDDHGDVGVGYDDIAAEFEPHWHLGAGAIVNGSPIPADEEYEPGNLIARTETTRFSPTDSSSVLGLADGSSIWVLGRGGLTTYQPDIGWATEELNPTDWIGDITVTFNPGLSTMPSGTAEFGMFVTNFANTEVDASIFSTFNPAGTAASNSFTMAVGGHQHFQWAFTELGQYDLSFTWTGTHVTDGLISTEATFSVQAVPEPSTIAMLGIAGAAGTIAVVRRRQQRSAARKTA